MTTRTRRARRGFTLAEMLVVLSIMVLLAGIAVPVFLSGRATTRRTGADNALRSALASAREAAIRHRTRAYLEFYPSTDPSARDYVEIWVRSNTDPLRDSLVRRIELPEFIRFDTARWTLEPGGQSDPVPASVTDPPDIIYRADGTLDDHPGTTTIVMMDTGEQNAFGYQVSNYLQILPATGLVVDVPHYENPSDTTSLLAKGWL